jgi:hypothetical protein
MKSLGKFLSKPVVFGLSLLVVAAFFLFAYPAMGALMLEHTPAGAGFDTAFFYTPAEAVQKAALYDSAGRVAMIRLHWTYDLVFPLAYGFFCLSAWASGLVLLAGTAKPVRFGFLLVPLAAALFDILENTAISFLLVADAPLPGVHALALLASASTMLKWLFVLPAFAGAIGLPCAGLAALVARSCRARNAH